ncbi:MAG: hypothetical protein U5J64_05125 [Halobacteriales archaeon]|nr:hypothetical protein [Halobacteriales archaeon]
MTENYRATKSRGSRRIEDTNASGSKDGSVVDCDRPCYEADSVLN